MTFPVPKDPGDRDPLFFLSPKEQNRADTGWHSITVFRYTVCCFKGKFQYLNDFVVNFLGLQVPLY